MEHNKPTCFVIQEFDNDGTFDKRYKETIKPALIESDVEPLRADEILGLQPVIDKIEEAIQQASICIAEVSTDNPNVWLELGYALAINRPVVILCDKQLRSKLPFDIQHRPVIFYRSDSKSGYEELEKRIKLNIKNELEKDNRITSAPVIKSGSHQLEDLQDYEVAILSTLLALWPTSSNGASHWELEKKIKSIGYAETALGLGVSKLLDKNLIIQNSETDMNGNDYFLYRITPEGISWLSSREDKLDLTLPIKQQAMPAPEDESFSDIPF
jgi:hypothetical protein